jgi:hypothetical protein
VEKLSPDVASEAVKDFGNLIENAADTDDIAAAAAPLMTGSPTAVEDFDGDVLERTPAAMQKVIRAWVAWLRMLLV